MKQLKLYFLFHINHINLYLCSCVYPQKTDRKIQLHSEFVMSSYEKKYYTKNLNFEKDISIKLDQNKRKIYREPLENSPFLNISTAY